MTAPKELNLARSWRPRTFSTIVGQDLSYREGQADFLCLQSISDKSMLGVNVGASHTHLGWDENPYFSEENFYYLTFKVVGITHHFNDWRWQAHLGFYVDPEEFNFGKSTIYEGLLWGRYAHSEKLGVHIGMIGQTGIDRDQVYPILGIDYTPSKQWKLNIIYPLSINANYLVSERWTLQAAAHYFKRRHRVSSSEANANGIFEYRNIGTESAIIYILNKHFSAKTYAGFTLGGDLKILTSSGSSLTFSEFDAAAYFGGSFTVQF